MLRTGAVERGVFFYFPFDEIVLRDDLGFYDVIDFLVTVIQDCAAYSVFQMAEVEVKHQTHLLP